MSGDRCAAGQSAEVTQTFTRASSESLREIRIGMDIGAIAITGEDRDDIQVEFHGAFEWL